MRLAVLVIALLLTAGPAHAADVPSIAAASDLQLVLPEIASAFTRDTGAAVKLTFGSSGNFRRQIAEGAPFELFLSADEGYVRALQEEGKARDEGALYATGRIAVVASIDSPLVTDAALEHLTSALAAGQVKRFAIANPEHAPYGRAAQQALTHAGLWDAIQPLLVLGENVAQAAQFATSGSAQGGIISYAQALALAKRLRVRYALIPAEWHAPLRQRMVLMKNAGTTARAFYRYVQGDFAREVLARHGFAMPAP
ncbi:MAG: molybdate ABC transporter substrate-binding protein [Betaproteobacteria bacterium]